MSAMANNLEYSVFRTSHQDVSINETYSLSILFPLFNLLIEMTLDLLTVTLRHSTVTTKRVETKFEYETDVVSSCPTHSPKTD